MILWHMMVTFLFNAMLSLFSQADEVENSIFSENAVVDNTDKQKV